MGWCCARDLQKSLLKRYSELCFITEGSLTYEAATGGMCAAICSLATCSMCQVLNWKRGKVRKSGVVLVEMEAG